jgi:hypothetical protein
MPSSFVIRNFMGIGKGSVCESCGLGITIPLSNASAHSTTCTVRGKLAPDLTASRLADGGLETGLAV